MGEYADMEIARQQREAGRRLAREHATWTAEQRRAAGQAEQATNQAKHDARGQALVAGLAHVATRCTELTSARLTISRNGNAIEALRGRSVLGRWWVDRRPQIGAKSVKQVMDFPAWLSALVRAEIHRDLAALVERRHAGPIPDGTPTELALAGAAPERVMRALEAEVAQDLEAGGDPARLFVDIPHLTVDDVAVLTTWASWEASVCTGQVLAAALVAVLHRAVQVSRMRAPRAASK